MNVLGILDGVDQEIPRFDQAQQQLTVSAGLVSPSMAGQDPAQLQAFGRQDKGKVKELLDRGVKDKDKIYQDIYSKFMQNRLFKSALKNKKIQFIEVI